MNEAQRDALLERLDERTARLAKLIEGNGRPGLLSDVTVLKEDMRQREREAGDLRDSVAAKRNQSILTNASITAIMVGVFTAAKAVFFDQK
jgi:hypothetical protein